MTLDSKIRDEIQNKARKESNSPLYVDSSNEIELKKTLEDPYFATMHYLLKQNEVLTRMKKMLLNKHKSVPFYIIPPDEKYYLREPIFDPESSPEQRINTLKKIQEDYSFKLGIAIDEKVNSRRKRRRMRIVKLTETLKNKREKLSRGNKERYTKFFLKNFSPEAISLKEEKSALINRDIVRRIHEAHMKRWAREQKRVEKLEMRKRDATKQREALRLEKLHRFERELAKKTARINKFLANRIARDSYRYSILLRQSQERIDHVTNHSKRSVGTQVKSKHPLDMAKSEKSRRNSKSRSLSNSTSLPNILMEQSGNNSGGASGNSPPNQPGGVEGNSISPSMMSRRFSIAASLVSATPRVKPRNVQKPFFNKNFTKNKPKFAQVDPMTGQRRENANTRPLGSPQRIVNHLVHGEYNKVVPDGFNIKTLTEKKSLSDLRKEKKRKEKRKEDELLRIAFGMPSIDYNLKHNMKIGGNDEKLFTAPGRYLSESEWIDVTNPQQISTTGECNMNVLANNNFAPTDRPGLLTRKALSAMTLTSSIGLTDQKTLNVYSGDLIGNCGPISATQLFNERETELNEGLLVELPNQMSTAWTWQNEEEQFEDMSILRSIRMKVRLRDRLFKEWLRSSLATSIRIKNHFNKMVDNESNNTLRKQTLLNNNISDYNSPSKTGRRFEIGRNSPLRVAARNGALKQQQEELYNRSQQRVEIELAQQQLYHKNAHHPINDYGSENQYSKQTTDHTSSPSPTKIKRKVSLFLPENDFRRRTSMSEPNFDAGSKGSWETDSPARSPVCLPISSRYNSHNNHNVMISSPKFNTSNNYASPLSLSRQLDLEEKKLTTALKNNEFLQKTPCIDTALGILGRAKNAMMSLFEKGTEHPHFDAYSDTEFRSSTVASPMMGARTRILGRDSWKTDEHADNHGIYCRPSGVDSGVSNHLEYLSNMKEGNNEHGTYPVSKALGDKMPLKSDNELILSLLPEDANEEAVKEGSKLNKRVQSEHFTVDDTFKLNNEEKNQEHVSKCFTFNFNNTISSSPSILKSSPVKKEFFFPPSPPTLSPIEHAVSPSRHLSASNNDTAPIDTMEMKFFASPPLEIAPVVMKVHVSGKVVQNSIDKRNKLHEETLKRNARKVDNFSKNKIQTPLPVYPEEQLDQKNQIAADAALERKFAFGGGISPFKELSNDGNSKGLKRTSDMLLQPVHLPINLPSSSLSERQKLQDHLQIAEEKKDTKKYHKALQGLGLELTSTEKRAKTPPIGLVRQVFKGGKPMQLPSKSSLMILPPNPIPTATSPVGDAFAHTPYTLAAEKISKRIMLQSSDRSMKPYIDSLGGHHKSVSVLQPGETLMLREEVKKMLVEDSGKKLKKINPMKETSDNNGIQRQLREEVRIDNARDIAQDVNSDGINISGVIDKALNDSAAKSNTNTLSPLNIKAKQATEITQFPQQSATSAYSPAKLKFPLPALSDIKSSVKRAAIEQPSGDDNSDASSRYSEQAVDPPYFEDAVMDEIVKACEEYTDQKETEMRAKLFHFIPAAERAEMALKSWERKFNERRKKLIDADMKRRETLRSFFLYQHQMRNQLKIDKEHERQKKKLQINALMELNEDQRIKKKTVVLEDYSSKMERFISNRSEGWYNKRLKKIELYNSRIRLGRVFHQALNVEKKRQIDNKNDSVQDRIKKTRQIAALQSKIKSKQMQQRRIIIKANIELSTAIRQSEIQEKMLRRLSMARRRKEEISNHPLRRFIEDIETENALVAEAEAVAISIRKRNQTSASVCGTIDFFMPNKGHAQHDKASESQRKSRRSSAIVAFNEDNNRNHDSGQSGERELKDVSSHEILNAVEEVMKRKRRVSIAPGNYFSQYTNIITQANTNSAISSDNVTGVGAVDTNKYQLFSPSKNATSAFTIAEKFNLIDNQYMPPKNFQLKSPLSSNGNALLVAGKLNSNFDASSTSQTNLDSLAQSVALKLLNKHRKSVNLHNENINNEERSSPHLGSTRRSAVTTSLAPNDSRKSVVFGLASTSLSPQSSSPHFLRRQSVIIDTEITKTSEETRHKLYEARLSRIGGMNDPASSVNSPRMSGVSVTYGLSSRRTSLSPLMSARKSRISSAIGDEIQLNGNNNITSRYESRRENNSIINNYNNKITFDDNFSAYDTKSVAIPSRGIQTKKVTILEPSATLYESTHSPVEYTNTTTPRFFDDRVGKTVDNNIAISTAQMQLIPSQRRGSITEVDLQNFPFKPLSESQLMPDDFLLTCSLQNLSPDALTVTVSSSESLEENGKDEGMEYILKDSNSMGKPLNFLSTTLHKTGRNAMIKKSNDSNSLKVHLGSASHNDDSMNHKIASMNVESSLETDLNSDLSQNGNYHTVRNDSRKEEATPRSLLTIKHLPDFLTSELLHATSKSKDIDDEVGNYAASLPDDSSNSFENRPSFDYSCLTPNERLERQINNAARDPVIQSFVFSGIVDEISAAIIDKEIDLFNNPYISNSHSDTDINSINSPSPPFTSHPDDYQIRGTKGYKDVRTLLSTRTNIASSVNWLETHRNINNSEPTRSEVIKGSDAYSSHSIPVSSRTHLIESSPPKSPVISSPPNNISLRTVNSPVNMASRHPEVSALVSPTLKSRASMKNRLEHDRLVMKGIVSSVLNVPSSNKDRGNSDLALSIIDEMGWIGDLPAIFCDRNPWEFSGQQPIPVPGWAYERLMPFVVTENMEYALSGAAVKDSLKLDMQRVKDKRRQNELELKQELKKTTFKHQNLLNLENLRPKSPSLTKNNNISRQTSSASQNNEIAFAPIQNQNLTIVQEQKQNFPSQMNSTIPDESNSNIKIPGVLKRCNTAPHFPNKEDRSQKSHLLSNHKTPSPLLRHKPFTITKPRSITRPHRQPPAWGSVPSRLPLGASLPSNHPRRFLKTPPASAAVLRAHHEKTPAPLGLCLIDPDVNTIPPLLHVPDPSRVRAQSVLPSSNRPAVLPRTDPLERSSTANRGIPATRKTFGSASSIQDTSFTSPANIRLTSASDLGMIGLPSANAGARIRGLGTNKSTGMNILERDIKEMEKINLENNRIPVRDSCDDTGRTANVLSTTIHESESSVMKTANSKSSSMPATQNLVRRQAQPSPLDPLPLPAFESLLPPNLRKVLSKAHITPLPMRPTHRQLQQLKHQYNHVHNVIGDDDDNTSDGANNERCTKATGSVFPVENITNAFQATSCHQETPILFKDLNGTNIDNINHNGNKSVDPVQNAANASLALAHEQQQRAQKEKEILMIELQHQVKDLARVTIGNHSTSNLLRSSTAPSTMSSLVGLSPQNKKIDSANNLLPESEERPRTSSTFGVAKRTHVGIVRDLGASRSGASKSVSRLQEKLLSCFDPASLSSGIGASYAVPEGVQGLCSDVFSVREVRNFERELWRQVLEEGSQPVTPRNETDLLTEDQDNNNNHDVSEGTLKSFENNNGEVPLMISSRNSVRGNTRELNRQPSTSRISTINTNNSSGTLLGNETLLGSSSRINERSNKGKKSMLNGQLENLFENALERYLTNSRNVHTHNVTSSLGSNKNFLADLKNESDSKKRGRTAGSGRDLSFSSEQKKPITVAHGIAEGSYLFEPRLKVGHNGRRYCDGRLTLEDLSKIGWDVSATTQEKWLDPEGVKELAKLGSNVLDEKIRKLKHDIAMNR